MMSFLSLALLMALIVLVLFACFMRGSFIQPNRGSAWRMPKHWHPIRSFVACFAFGLLVACSTSSVQSSVASLEVGLTTAETAATAYAKLPTCGGQVQVCSDPATVAKIKAADQVAFKTIKAAEASAAAGGSPSLTAAQAALTALQSLIPGASR